ncbi:DNA polymerase nu-like [Bolinopsis microptera]|uniref:DNA polymerase nu-like n=1 Tax=Bolinopsis microptera TaxID=2820187 RepID=UPI003079C732
MGQTGICIDKKELHLLSIYLTKRLSVIEQEASSVLGRHVLLTSPVQLRQILYEELKLDEKIPDNMSRTAAKREKSTSEACLLKLTELHPLPRIILAHRRISKLKSTYVDGLHQYMKFGKLYPSWDQTSAATGRLAAFNPNVQAFPKDVIENNVDDEQSSHSVREIIVPSLGCQFVAVDFCSIEMRILAHFAKDQELIEMFKSSDDIFTTLTASWKSIPSESVSNVERNKTKRVCYAIIYGVGIPKLSQILKVSLSEAKMLMSSFLAKFQNISKFTNAVIKRARGTKKLRTILNRLRHFPDINQSNFALRKSIERQAVNFVIQGSAADICKVSMLKLSDYLKSNNQVNAQLLIQIHDELLYEVYHENVDQFARVIYQMLESSEFTSEIHLSVPLKVKVEVGESWGKMAEFSNL